MVKLTHSVNAIANLLCSIYEYDCILNYPGDQVVGAAVMSGFKEHLPDWWLHLESDLVQGVRKVIRPGLFFRACAVSHPDLDSYAAKKYLDEQQGQLWDINYLKERIKAENQYDPPSRQFEKAVTFVELYYNLLLMERDTYFAHNTTSRYLVASGLAFRRFGIEAITVDAVKDQKAERDSELDSMEKEGRNVTDLRLYYDFFDKHILPVRIEKDKRKYMDAEPWDSLLQRTGSSETSQLVTGETQPQLPNRDLYFEKGLVKTIASFFSGNE